MARTFGRMGTICLGVYLLLQGLVLIASLSFAGLTLVMGALALVAGVLLLLGR